ncbi:hypothetical protein F0Q45_25100 [Mycobacterium simiae]|uniref:4Fe-4S Wbl-type domain-containing protein n=1 Tax=Mycobacterium simiae TaxID=1784 RepID=A0A5B1BAR3_MYCSI|nr:WhiB family transcriptional regulator [Mycobacterium simiae]KAA1244169.1 hypothetical protein F0Q45_25100 [Mycobacterium simiae]
MNHKNDTAPPPPTPCLSHPGDWVDPARKAFTRRQCLSCPSLGGCAEDALRQRPSYGMWAGVWVNGDFAAKRPLLIGRRSQGSRPPKSPDPQPDPPPSPPIAPAVGTLVTAPPAPVVAALITARASANCEIMAPACTYRQSAIFTRRRRPPRTALASPADALAACANCIELIEHTDLPTARDLGYLVDPRTTTSSVPVLWRQHRWVYLDTRGRLHPTSGPELVEIA